MSLVAGLQELDKTDVGRAGGKAASLGELLRAGLPVPRGFVLTTDAYQQFVAANAYQPEIECLARAAHADDAAALETASRSIAALFATGVLPDAVAAAVRAAYQQMGRPCVAVRSSATAEDLAEASFAGQMESFLNVRGETALLDAVRRCWASLWTARAISYRARQGISPSAVRLAVVVQELVEADAAGVLFTANPVTGHRHQMVVDAVWGLGEALVSGRATPDHWVVNAADGTVLEARVARKDAMTARVEDGTRLVPVPEELRDRPVLEPAQLAALVALGGRAAAHFGGPQDIEWVLSKGVVYVVQSRPITSLFPLPQPQPGARGLHVYLCFNIVQGFVEPFTPMGLCFFHSFGKGLYPARTAPKSRGGQPLFRVAAGRIFTDLTTALQYSWARRFFPRMTGIIDHHLPGILRALAARWRELPTRQQPLGMKLPARLVPSLLGRLGAVLLFPETAAQRLAVRAERLVRRFERQAAAAQSPDDCRRLVDETLPAWWPPFMALLYPFVFPGVGSRFLADALLRRWLNDPAAIQPVLRSLPHNPTMEMDLTLWRVSRVLKSEGVEPSADHPEVRKFLARYGHRGVREIDVGMPRWRDDPAHVLNVLRTYLAHGADADPERQFRQGEQAAADACRNLVQRVRQTRGRMRAWLLAFLLHRIRAMLGYREYPKFLLVRVIAAVRAALARAGTALVAAGRLERADDVCFLDLADLASAGDLRAVAAKNRADYQRELGRRAVPRVMTSEGETFCTAPGTVPGALVGTAASPGSYEGTVRVIFDPTGAKLEPGEVLVAPGTDPAWTPLFLSAGALVMELGGVMSHGSVVAREYGIPAVVGVSAATRELRTGQRVRVDGEAGQVVPLPSQDDRASGGR